MISTFFSKLQMIFYYVWNLEVSEIYAELYS